MAEKARILAPKETAVNGWENTLPHYRINNQQERNCWKRCFLCGLCRGNIARVIVKFSDGVHLKAPRSRNQGLLYWRGPAAIYRSVSQSGSDVKYRDLVIQVAGRVWRLPEPSDSKIWSKIPTGFERRTVDWRGPAVRDTVAYGATNIALHMKADPSQCQRGDYAYIYVQRKGHMVA
jgi:hypothetical protein